MILSGWSGGGETQGGWFARPRGGGACKHTPYA